MKCVLILYILIFILDKKVNCRNTKYHQKSFEQLNREYRWTVLPQMENLDLCNKQICKVHNNDSNKITRPHTLCYNQNYVANECRNFSMAQSNIRNFVLGHNGLRNRVVKTGKNFVKNMNYVVTF